MVIERPYDIRRRIRNAVLAHALLRWESAALIALTILATAVAIMLAGSGLVPGQTWVGCLLFGLAGEMVLFTISVTDTRSISVVADRLLRDAFDPEALSSELLRRHVLKAIDYRGRIEAVSRRRLGVTLPAVFDETVGHIDGWLNNIFRLGERIDAFQSASALGRADKSHIEHRLTELRTQRQDEADPRTKERIAATIEGLGQQLKPIEELDATLKRAELELERTVSALGTVYSQLVLASAQGMDVIAAQQLGTEIADEVHQIDDMLIAMDAAYERERDPSQMSFATIAMEDRN